MLVDTVNVRAVRILLECNLVFVIFFKKSSAKNEGPLVSTDARLPGVWRESKKRKRTWYNLVVMEINFLSILFYFQTLRMQVNYCCRFRGGLGGTYCDIVDFAGPGVCKGNDVRRNVIKFSRSRDFVTNLTKNLKSMRPPFARIMIYSYLRFITR